MNQLRRIWLIHEDHTWQIEAHSFDDIRDGSLPLDIKRHMGHDRVDFKLIGFLAGCPVYCDLRITYI